MSIRMKARESFVDAVLPMLVSLSVKEGLTPDAGVRLGQALRGVCQRCIEQGFIPGDPKAELEIQLLRRPGRVCVAVCDKGIPRNGPEEVHVQVDKVASLNLGPQGMRLELTQHLPLAAAADVIGDEAKSLELVRLPEDTPLEVRLMRPDDTAELAKCVYYAYGYTYPGEFIYYPERVREMLEHGELVSGVAVGPDGSIYGHASLTWPVKDSPVAECGQAMVDPRCRGRKVFERIKSFLVEEATRRQLLGVVSMAVTIHPFTQRANLALGGTEVGLLLGFVPAMDVKQIKSGQVPGRQAVMAMYSRANLEAAREVYVPEPDQELAEAIYAKAGMARTFLAGQEPFGTTELNVQLLANWGQGFIRVSWCGTDFGELLQRRLRQLCLAGALFIQLELPLADPVTPAAAAIARGMGFIFGAVLPEMNQGDVLVYQYLNNVEVQGGAIHTASELGQRIAAKVLEELPQ